MAFFMNRFLLEEVMKRQPEGEGRMSLAVKPVGGQP
jgi:hypothetical protein